MEVLQSSSVVEGGQLNTVFVRHTYLSPSRSFEVL